MTAGPALRLFHRQSRINLALQGGGAHGAFTWGVLDRMLEDETLDIGWISGTSAGAVNAVAVAAGLVEGGRAGARAKLSAVWEAVAKAGVPDLLRFNPFLAGMSRSGALANMATMFSPYEFNPMGFDPLRRLLEAHIDFAVLRSTTGPELLIAATEVESGITRLFRRGELTVESVLASACLPTVHHAVEIDGEAYWDGGFSANPDMLTLARQSPVGDTLIIQLNALEKPGQPKSTREIAGQVNQITFNQPYVREIEMIEAIRTMHAGWRRMRGDDYSRIARHRFHLIDAGRYTAGLSAESKGKPEVQLLLYLRDAGRSEAAKWFERHRPDVGRRATVDLGAHMRAARGRRLELPVEAEEQRGQTAAPDEAA
jgi:NTE family protein